MEVNTMIAKTVREKEYFAYYTNKEGTPLGTAHKFFTSDKQAIKEFNFHIKAIGGTDIQIFKEVVGVPIRSFKAVA
jgi:hypothetical protein